MIRHILLAFIIYTLAPKDFGEEGGCSVCHGANNPADQATEQELLTLLKDTSKLCQQDKYENPEKPQEKLEVPKYVRDFGNKLAAILDDKKGFNVYRLLKEVDGKLSPGDRQKLTDQVKQLAKDELEIEQTKSQKAADPKIKGEVVPLKKEEFEEEVNKRIAELSTPLQFVKVLLRDKLFASQDIAHLYFSATYSLLNDAIRYTASKLMANNVKDLVQLKDAVEIVSNGSAPFYKQTWFIVTIVVFAIGVVVVIVFIVLSIRKPPK
jgi:hypothetical protein